MFGDDGAFKGYRGTGRDITDLKKVEEALRASEARLAGMISIAPEAIIAVNEKFRISIFNQGAEKIFGYQASEVLGQPLDLLVPARFRNRHRSHMDEFQNSPEESRSMTERGGITGLRKDGVEFPAEASVSKLELQGRQVFTVMLHDISARRRTEAEMQAARERAEYADRAKSEFLANMSHELRTPLNAILGFAQLIRDQAFGSRAMDRYVGYAGDINDSGEHLLAIVNDILDLSKIEAGKTELDEHEIDAEKIVDACETLVKGRARDFGISLRTDIGNCGVKFLADERMIKQVLLNLLSNAIKFTSAGGHVVISAHRADNGRLEFQVTDDGIGIASEDLPKVLTTFGQVQGAMTRDHEGTGLGLPLVASLAKLHGGGLDLESEIGVGTTATVWFPKERVVVSS